MVAHLWANEQQESANGSNFYFDGSSIYSYGRHFEAGRIVRNKRGERAYLINEKSIPVLRQNINVMFDTLYQPEQWFSLSVMICTILVICYLL